MVDTNDFGHIRNFLSWTTTNHPVSKAIGNTSAYRYNLHGTDTTHLNDWGSVVFGRMVADLILGHDPVVPSDTDWTPDSDDYFTQYFISNETLSEEIWGGVVA